MAARNAIELRIGGAELEALRRVANLPEKNTETKSAAGS
jgi:hypothetical protein